MPYTLPDRQQKAFHHLSPLLQEGWSLEFSYGYTVTYHSNGADMVVEHQTVVSAKISKTKEGGVYGRLEVNASYNDTLPEQGEQDLDAWALDYMRAAREELRERQRLV
jgi:hypothetical protein